MAIIDALSWRYATKQFDNTRVLSDAKIQLLKEAFNLTATSYGLQTLKLVILKDKTRREGLLQYAYEQRQVADASHLFIICVQNDIDHTDVDVHFENVKTIRDTPESIVSPFRTQLKSTLGNMNADEKHNWAVNQAYIALGNLMTVCAVERIDSCPMEGFDRAAFDEILGLKAHGLRSVLLLPVGYRAEDDKFATFKKVRKPVDDVVIEL